MPGDIILNEDWSEYDRKKSARSEDVLFFNCKEEWEVRYLIDVLHQRFENLLSESTLVKAIQASCNETGNKVTRETFVHHVMHKLIS